MVRRKKMETVTITTEFGETKRIKLPKAIYSGMDELSTGVWLKKLYYGEKSGRMFAKKHSQWIGTKTPYWVELSVSEFLTLCEIAGINPPEQITPEIVE